MSKIIVVGLSLVLLSACTREQVQDGISSSLRNVCAQNSGRCDVHCGAGESSNRYGQCQKN